MDWLISLTASVRNEVIFFEFPIVDCRVDIVRLNCRSYAYEVKSKRDTVNRLVAQTEESLEVFEYVYAVLNSQEAPIEWLSPAIGIIEAQTDGDALSFEVVRRPKVNRPSSPLKQLQLLSIPEVQDLVAKKQLPVSDEAIHETEQILEYMEPDEVNLAFKQILRKRYRDNWRNYLAQRNGQRLYLLA